MKGCDWEKPSFRVFMGSEKEPEKCLRCKAKNSKCKVFNDYSEFIDRGYILIDRRKKK